MQVVLNVIIIVSLFLPPLLQGENIVHITDAHAGGAETADIIQVVTGAEQEKPAMTVVTGDVVNCGMQTYLDYDNPDVTDYDVAKVIRRKNWFAVRGNHEYAWTGYAGAARFKKLFGSCHGVRDIGGWRFIGMDFSIPYSEAAFITPDELQWLEKALKEADGKPCVLCLHHPPFFPGKDFILNQDLLKPLLKKYPVRLILAGHTHKNSMYVAHGVPVVVTGSAFNGWYSALDIHGKKIDMTTKNFFKPELSQKRVAIYDEKGVLAPQKIIRQESSEGSPSKPEPSPHAAYKTEDAGIYIPPARINNSLYFSNSLGHCWELRLPQKGRKFTEELFKSSLRKIADAKGNMAFPFAGPDNRPCFISTQGLLILPDKAVELNRMISCQPIVQDDILVLGTLTGTWLLYTSPDPRDQRRPRIPSSA